MIGVTVNCSSAVDMNRLESACRKRGIGCSFEQGEVERLLKIDGRSLAEIAEAFAEAQIKPWGKGSAPAEDLARSRYAAAALSCLGCLQALANFPGELSADEMRAHAKVTADAHYQTIISGGREADAS